jgi:hypothetical protein
MKGFKLPGVVWTVLLVALPSMAVWLEQFFPGAIWAAPIAGLLLIAAKVVEVLKADADASAPMGVDLASFESMPATKADVPSLWWG